GDVVTALGQEAEQAAAVAAVETLRAAAGDSPIAACLRPPPEDIGWQAAARVAVDVLGTRFPDQFVYVTVCDDADRNWRSVVAETAGPDMPDTTGEQTLVPLSAGAFVEIRHLDPDERLDTESVSRLSSGGYTAVAAEIDTPLAADVVERSAEALLSTAFAALILITPTDDVDPTALVGSFSNVVLTGNTLPEGYSSVLAPGVAANESWTRTNVATVSYLRTTESAAGVAAEFVGTDIYLLGLASPESGVVEVWIDPGSATAPPTNVIKLAALQAQDVAIPIARGLPAARHEVVLRAVTEGSQSVMISGLFVTGKPATAWNGAMAACSLIAIAAAALTERTFAAITRIRRQSGPTRRRVLTGHPRVFARER
ncbi:MAG: hypothetical protein ACRD1H_15000, partial [Vicinamibacterales bacterium]